MFQSSDSVVYKTGRFFLVGFMGAGKTTLGRALAARYRKIFVDADRCVAQQAGRSVATIFARDGESGFRELEQRVLSQLTRQPNIVLATGGGAVLTAENCLHLSARGLIIYLFVELDELLCRMQRQTHRPLCRGAHPKHALASLWHQRDPLYRKLAHLTVETSRLSVEASLKKLDFQLQNREVLALHPSKKAIYS